MVINNLYYLASMTLPEVTVPGEEMPSYPSGGGGVQPEIDPDVIEGGIQTVLNGVGNLIDFAETILTFMLNNPILTFMLATGFVSIGIAIFRKIKGSVKM